MKKIRLFLSLFLLGGLSSGLLTPVQAQQPFDDALEKSVHPIHSQIMDGNYMAGKTDVLDFLYWFIDIIIPIVIVCGIAVVLFGAYKMMTSEKEDAVKEGWMLIIYGVIGILIMVAAKFLGNTLVSNVITQNLQDGVGLKGVLVAESLYKNIFMPFIKIAAYLSSGILFFMMVSRVFTFLTSSDESTRKKAWGIIARTVIGILIILAANQIVEAIFGKRDQVINQSATDLGDIGSGIYEVQTIPILYNIINRVMGLTALAVTILIIFQAFQLLTKPNDEKIVGQLKKTIIYVAIGIAIIGAGYVISNLLVIN